MYIPSALKMETTQETHAFINEFGFAVVISDPLEASHLPFILRPDEGDLGTLYSHFAKANSQWENIDGKEALVIFSGPHAYISPSWYAKPPGVPTWNYAAVHVYGVVEVLTSNGTLEVVEATVNKYEPSLLDKRDIITDEYRDKLLRGIVGFKLTISKIEGKLKLGQQRSLEDQSGVVKGLQSSDDHDSRGLVNYMLRKAVGAGDC